MNLDTEYIPKREFIYPEGAEKQRGRFELAFGQIGASCMVGATIGGLGGFYNGLKLTKLEGQTGNLRRTQYVSYHSTW